MKRNSLLIGLLFFSVLHSSAQKERPQLAEGLTQVHDLFNASMNASVSCYRIPALVTAPNGDLVVAIDKRVPSCHDLRGSDDINIVIRRSSDNGKSWNKSEDITSQIAKPEWHNDFKFITSGRRIQTSTGKLLHCMVNLDSGLHLFGSDDHGKSWYLIDTPIIPGNESKSS